ncbi:MAG: iron-containing alcohol dehydrogenase [Candidatus Thorarchaeota archaeon]|nr:MAG: iron-containing alcohol dehydrogenase [Candidatus Thorarchaeota archaeon]
MSSADPHTVIIGEGVIGEVVNLLADCESPLLVTDEQIYGRYGTSVDELLGTKDRWLMVSDYEKKRYSMAYGTDMILGFGGGRSIDVAKLLARDTGLDWMAIPTAASHDGIASDVASVSQNGYRYSVKCKSPKAVIADLSIIAEAPPRLRLAGIGDVVSKASSLDEWRLGHETRGEPFDDAIFSFVNSALSSVLKDNSLDALIKAQIDCGKAMSQFGSSRPCSGTEHAISHALDRDQLDLHGLQVALATPLCVYYLHGSGYAKYRTSDLIGFFKETRIPTRLTDFGIGRERFLDSIRHAKEIMKKRDRYSILEHVGASDSDIVATLMELSMIDG